MTARWQQAASGPQCIAGCGSPVPTMSLVLHTRKDAAGVPAVGAYSLAGSLVSLGTWSPVTRPLSSPRPMAKGGHRPHPVAPRAGRDDSAEPCVALGAPGGAGGSFRRLERDFSSDSAPRPPLCCHVPNFCLSCFFLFCWIGLALPFINLILFFQFTQTKLGSFNII